MVILGVGVVVDDYDDADVHFCSACVHRLTILYTARLQWVTAGQNKMHVFIHVNILGHYFIQQYTVEDWKHLDKMKLNEPGRQKLGSY